MAHLKDEGMIATSEIATKIADFTYSKYMRDTRQALKDFDDGKDSMLIDDMVNMNIMLTGMVSDLSTGGKQLAVAHNFYDAVCCMYKDVRRKYLHGENRCHGPASSAGCQRTSGGGNRRTEAFLREVGIPVSIREAGVPQDGLEELITYVHRVTIPDDMELLEQIRDGLSISCN